MHPVKRFISYLEEIPALMIQMLQYRIRVAFRKKLSLFVFHSGFNLITELTISDNFLSTNDCEFSSSSWTVFRIIKTYNIPAAGIMFRNNIRDNHRSVPATHGTQEKRSTSSVGSAAPPPPTTRVPQSWHADWRCRNHHKKWSLRLYV